ncbi:MAG: hypothetical protein JW816_03035 [Candidatus Buchananbacteria bacterium]|nr:hypothetical protein [Candidatus Buchananbacteria bacterium]
MGFFWSRGGGETSSGQSQENWRLPDSEKLNQSSETEPVTVANIGFEAIFANVGDNLDEQLRIVDDFESGLERAIEYFNAQIESHNTPDLNRIFMSLTPEERIGFLANKTELARRLKEIIALSNFLQSKKGTDFPHIETILGDRNLLKYTILSGEKMLKKFEVE